VGGVGWVAITKRAIYMEIEKIAKAIAVIKVYRNRRFWNR
jgi:hypothetical protein